ncbi:alpha/beta fold hydrolase [Streptomyces sp. NPDC020875]|uniref:alpha/beta hydrolase n=1 Tax=Streptomyces sp. NPDC020875 TaxID=3154898 RepID=UPI003402303B
MRSKYLTPALALGVLTGALAVSPATAAEPPARQQSPAPASLDWRTCDIPPDPDHPTPADVRCATVTVPLDYREPNGKKLGIEIARIPAANPAERIGSLMLNTGGPGGEAVGMTPMLEAMLPGALKDRYDRIAIDPRGVGRSAPISCGLTPEEQQTLYPYAKGGFDRGVALNRSFAEKCAAKYGDDLRHFTTRNTARDMDAVRAALGERKTHYLGWSYGTYLGAVYTQMFPERSGRIVLDSAVDPKDAWRGEWLAWGSESHRQLDRWTRWAARHPELHRLGDTPAKVRASFWRLIAAADRKPLRLEGGTLDGDGLRNALWYRFDTVRTATKLVDNLRQVAAGRPYEEFPSDDLPSAEVGTDDMSASWAITCADASWPKSVATYRADARRAKARYPLYGDYASGTTPCSFWKDEPVEPPTEVRNSVGALIVQNEWDAQTPLSQAKGLRADMKGSRMLLVENGEDHAVYGMGRSACADKATTDYLVTGKLPERDLTCAPNSPGSRTTDRFTPSWQTPMPR